jgi:hypothetical protein
MRDFKGMKRQRGRNRSSGGNSGKPQHNTNRAFDSNGPDGVKVRGAAQHVYEKYQQLARDAHTAGDRVLAENYLQHAEHYFRVMRAMQPQRPISEIIGRDQFVSGYDIDFEDESGLGDAGEADASDGQGGDGGDVADRFEPRRDERPREDYRPREETRYSEPRSRDDRTRDDRAREERPRDDRSQQGRYQADRSSPERQASDRPTSDRPASDRPTSGASSTDRSQQDRSGGNRSGPEERPRNSRDDRPRSEPRAEPTERPSADAMSIVEPQATPLPAPVAAPAPANMLRADDGDVSHAPAFLQVRPAEPREEGAAEPRRPRRRRTPASFENSEAPPAAVVPTSEEV